MNEGTQVRQHPPRARSGLIALLNERGIILSLSREAIDAFGPKAARMTGRSIFSLSHSDDRADIATTMQRAAARPGDAYGCSFRLWRGANPAVSLNVRMRALLHDTRHAFAAVASTDLDQGALARELAAREGELALVASHLRLAQSEERQRIADLLHDGVGQSLALAKFHVDGIADPAGPPASAVDTAAGHLQEAIDAVRSLTDVLSSALLKEQGLDAALEELGQSVGARDALQFALSSRPRRRRLSEPARVAIYRIIRELIVNVVKHSNARRVRVSIGEDGDFLRLAVSDDGRGMSPNEWSAPGNGLKSVRRMVRELDGMVNLITRAGRGTQVMISVPFSRVGASK